MEMPIFERIFSTPASSGGPQALLGVGADEVAGVGLVGLRGHGLQGEPRAHRVGAVAEQRGDEVGVADVVGEHDQAGVGPPPVGDQALVHRAEQPAATGSGARSPVGLAGVDHEDAGALGDERVGGGGRRLDRGPQAVGPVGDGEAGVDAAHRERAAARGEQRVDGGGVEEERLEA